MANFETNAVKAYNKPVPPRAAGDVRVAEGKVTLPNTLAADDLVKLVKLPADCVPVDCILASDDLDTDATPAIVVNVGLLNAAEDDLTANTELIKDSTVCQAGGLERMNSVLGKKNITVSRTADRTIALKVGTVAATKAAGEVKFTLMYRAAEYGV